MSEPAAERPVRGSAPPPQRGNALTRKYGPLPGWGWAGLAAVAAVGVWWWRNRQASQTGTATNTVTGVDYSGELATIQSEIQNLQGGKSTGGSTESWTMHTATGKHSLNQLAGQYGTSLAQFFTWQRESPLDQEGLQDIIEWMKFPDRKHSNIVYYTPATDTTTTTTSAAQAAGTTTDTTAAETAAGGSSGTGGGSASSPASGAASPAATPKPKKAPGPPKKKGRR